MIRDIVCYYASEKGREDEAARSDEKVVRLKGGRIGANLGLRGLDVSFLSALKFVLCLICSLSSRY